MGSLYRILMVWCALLTVNFLCKIIIGAIATGDILTTIFVIAAGSCTIHCLIEALDKKEPKQWNKNDNQKQ